MKVNMELFKDPLSTQFYVNRAESEKELLKLLTDDIAIIRFGGIQVLLSNNGSPYIVNFLVLNEEEQLRIIESLLTLPMISVEELMPLVLPLRNSEFEPVKILLKNQLAELIEAYDFNLIELVQKNLDLNNIIDKELLESLEKSYSIYNEENKLRNSIKEFNPLDNELEFVELFYRLELEKQAEHIEKAQAKSFMTYIAKTMHIIRGSGFNTEENGTISMMGTVGISRLVDQRYSINPDQYEWKFRRNATGQNYNTAAEK
jgi:hypothetical protein